MLDGIFEFTESSLGTRQGVQARSRNDHSLEQHSVEFKSVYLADSHSAPGHLFLHSLKLAKRFVCFRQFLPCGLVACQCRFALRDHAGLCRQKSCPQFFAPCLGFSDRSLVPVENWKRRRESNCEETISLFVCVTWPELHVGILLGNFQLKIRFRRRVLGQSSPNV